MSTFEFGDAVHFTHHYIRMIDGKRAAWPRGDKNRYHHPGWFWDRSLLSLHPDSALPERPPVPRWGSGYTTPVTWMRCPNLNPDWRSKEAPHIVGIFGGTCRKSEGWMSSYREEFGYGYKHHAYVPLAEVMVRPTTNARPLMFVVHLDDLASVDR